MDTKKDIRKSFIERRNRLNAGEVIRNSEDIFNRLCSLEEYKNAAVIMAYMSFGNEVMTGPFIEKCFRDGKRVALPKVMSASKTCRSLAAFEIKAPAGNLVPGYRGILEPDASVLEMLEPVAIDLAVVPGVAFDRLCNRMGYGAGYYDRFLTQLRTECIKAGAAFDMQLAERLPTDEFDFRLDMVITESTVYNCRTYIHENE